MSLYNLVHGYSPACIMILPMLGKKPDEYPRFRDCFVEDWDALEVGVLTRVGSGNRGQGYGEEELYKEPNYVRTYDEDFDRTYATYVFKVPDKWVEDFKAIREGALKSVSDEYIALVKEWYPKLAEKGVIDKAFDRVDNQEENTDE